MDKYWVTDTSSVFNDSLWSLSSGGAVGAGVPGVSDIAVFDRYSGSCEIDSVTSISGMILNSDFSNSVTYDHTINLNLLTLNGGLLTATSDSSIKVSGDVTCSIGFSSTAPTNNANVVMNSLVTQYITTEGGVFPNLVIDKDTSNQVKLLGYSPFRLNGDLVINDGTFNTNNIDVALTGA